MESNILIMYYNKEKNTYHPIILNELELNHIESVLLDLQTKKGQKNTIMVDEQSYLIIKEDESNEKDNGDI